MKDKESVLGKNEITNALVEEGFDEDEASRAYEIILDELERGLRTGRVLYFRRMFKVWPARMPPRRYWDNWNKKHIYFGERIMLKIKPFFLKDRNMPATRKIRAGRRSREMEKEISLAEMPPNNNPTVLAISRGQLGKANRALKKLGVSLPSLEEKERAVRFFLNRGIDPILYSSASLAKQIRSLHNNHVQEINRNGQEPPKNA